MYVLSPVWRTRELKPPLNVHYTYITVAQGTLIINRIRVGPTTVAFCLLFIGFELGISSQT